MSDLGIEALAVDSEAQHSRLGRFAAHTAMTAMAIVAFGAAPAHAQTDHEKPVSKPHLELGVSSQDLVKNDDENLNNVVLGSMNQMLGKGGWLRFIVWPSQDMSTDETVIEQAKTNGFKVSVDVACGGGNVSKADMQEKFTYVMEQIGSQVDEIAVCDEPNISNTLPQEYRSMYKTAYSVVKRANPKVRVLLGDFSSEAFNERKNGMTTSQYAKRVFACPANSTTVKCPIYTDGVADHPYSLVRAANKLDGVQGEEGYRYIPLLEKQITRANKAGNLQISRSNHTKPGIYLQETGYWTNAGNPKLDDTPGGKMLYKTEAVRPRLYQTIINQVCRYNYVERLMFYGYQTPKVGWPGEWRTQLVDQFLQPLPTWRGIRQQRLNRTDCIK